jgi:hypothetical protein
MILSYLFWLIWIVFIGLLAGVFLADNLPDSYQKIHSILLWVWLWGIIAYFIARGMRKPLRDLLKIAFIAALIIAGSMGFLDKPREEEFVSTLTVGKESTTTKTTFLTTYAGMIVGIILANFRKRYRE